MKVFVDSANLGHIEQALGRGFVAGITTLMTEHPKTTEAVQPFLADFRKWSTPAG